jgi:hypothetical protein
LRLHSLLEKANEIFFAAGQLLELKRCRANFAVKINAVVEQGDLLFIELVSVILYVVDGYDLGLLVCHFVYS